MRALGFLGLAIVLTLTAFCAALFAQPTAPTPVYQVIVHPDNPSVAVDHKFLQDAFLKKITAWPGGEGIRPVDLVPDSGIRRRFTESVLKRSVDAVRNYWQQRIFSGRDVPPPELDTDDAVVTYVLKHEGAIGYVSSGAGLRGAKALAVR
jgi:ABC-type phosphate transport system substrate-binding protein